MITNDFPVFADTMEEIVITVLKGAMTLLLVGVICILIASFYGLNLSNLQRSSSTEDLYETYYFNDVQYNYPYYGSYYGYEGRSLKNELMTKARSLFDR